LNFGLHFITCRRSKVSGVVARHPTELTSKADKKKTRKMRSVGGVNLKLYKGTRKK